MKKIIKSVVIILILSLIGCCLFGCYKYFSTVPQDKLFIGKNDENKTVYTVVYKVELTKKAPVTYQWLIGGKALNEDNFKNISKFFPNQPDKAFSISGYDGDTLTIKVNRPYGNQDNDDQWKLTSATYSIVCNVTQDKYIHSTEPVTLYIYSGVIQKPQNQ